MAPAARNGVCVSVCEARWITDIHVELEDLGKERRLAERKLIRTSGKDCSQIKIPDLIPLTSDTLPQETNLFSRAEWKAKASKVRPAHEPLSGWSPVPPTFSPFQMYTGPSPWPGAV